MKTKFFACIIALSLMIGAIVAPTTYAINVFTNSTQSGSETVTNKGGTDFQTTITKIVSVLLFVVGAIAVIAIIMGGLRYVMSNGDQSSIKGAKDTILYACIGLAVALLAYAIVGFVVTKFK